MAKQGEKLSTILDHSYMMNNSTCTVGAIEAYRTLPGIGPLFRINADDLDASAIVEYERMYRSKVEMQTYNFESVSNLYVGFFVFFCLP